MHAAHRAASTGGTIGARRRRLGDLEGVRRLVAEPLARVVSEKALERGRELGHAIRDALRHDAKVRPGHVHRRGGAFLGGPGQLRTALL